MTFYIDDTTLKPPQHKRFESYPEVVSYLESMSKRAYGQNKRQRTFLLEELGNGPDDHYSTLFVRSMQETFDLGIIRDNRRTRCDITTIIAFQKPEYGN